MFAPPRFYVPSYETLVQMPMAERLEYFIPLALAWMVIGYCMLIFYFGKRR